MKFFTAFVVLLGAAHTSATAITLPEDTDCTNLGGAFEVNLLPPGITEHRKCAGHPLGNHTKTPGAIQKRSCAFNQYGCDRGSCWKKCGPFDGPWCWQAWNFGTGGWVGCSKDSDCEPGKLSGADCGICSDPVCGCSC